MVVLYVNSNIMCYSRHFNFVFFLNRKIRKIDVSRKFQVGPITIELLARLESTTQATLFNT